MLLSNTLKVSVQLCSCPKLLQLHVCRGYFHPLSYRQEFYLQMVSRQPCIHAQHFPSRVDQYRPHQTSDNIELVKTDCHTDVVLILGDVVLILGGYTSLAQRMDECVNTIQGGNMAVLGGVDQKAKDPH